MLIGKVINGMYRLTLVLLKKDKKHQKQTFWRVSFLKNAVLSSKDVENSLKTIQKRVGTGIDK